MYGTEASIPEPKQVSAGGITALYHGGYLRYIKFQGHELLRMINFMVRDHDWNTVPQKVRDEEIKVGENSFEIYFTALSELNEVKFNWDCHIIGTQDQEISFEITGTALSDFKRNRVGFTVLHPIRECKGKKVMIGHADGGSAVYEFPVLISPLQPFYNIRSMQWTVAGTQVHLEFEGEIFETEDQRNWTDESYKTYCTPLELPFPQQLLTGEQVKQKIVLKVLDDDLRANGSTDSEGLTFKIPEQGFKLPKIGVGRANGYNLGTSQILSLSELNLDHYQADLKMFTNDWQLHWQSICEESQLLGLKLELSLFFQNTEKELQRFLSFSGNAPVIARINLFDQDKKTTSNDTIEIAADRLRSKFGQIKIGAGTNAFFTELNRERVYHPGLDYLVYSLNPQVHAFDNNSLVESLYAQPDTVHTAHSFSRGLPVNISPITFKMRWNPNATSAEQAPLPEADTRQKSLFGAGWLLGSIQNLLSTEVESVSYFETTGSRGIMDVPAEGGLLKYPIFLVLEYLLNHKDQKFFPIQASDGFSLGGVAIGSDLSRLILVNYTGKPLEIWVPEAISGMRGRLVEGDTAWDLMIGKIELPQLPEFPVQQTIRLSPFSIGFFSK